MLLLGQNLEYSRLIDTTLIGMMPSGTALYNGTEISSNVLSPPAGKVWKIQSFMLGTPDDNIVYCANTNNSYASIINNSLFSFCILKDDGIMLNEFSNGNDVVDKSHQLPIWINSNTTLSTKFRVNDLPSNPICIWGNYTWKAWFSILEFNVN
tara:strand:- start:269 stop:727 length:459 start_codon:yes stop_codon:yes gene_type:complete